MTAARITVVTSGHLSTCPRMLKAADALADDGHDVRVVATRHEPWATETDLVVQATRRWRLVTIDYRRGEAGSTYWRTGARYRAARVVAETLGPDRSPFPVLTRAFGRVHTELVAAAAAESTDLLYGGTTGALAAVAEAAGRLRVPYALDLEDLHHGEASGVGAPFEDALALRIERAVLPQASFLTTSSEAIGQAYTARYGVEPLVVHNTFPLPSCPPDPVANPRERFRAYWFSQTIGPGRGLEDAIVALGRIPVSTELVLRGRPQEGYLETLWTLADAQRNRVRVSHVPPASPDAMVDLARGFDVGLALEQATPPNRRLCLTNKAFTYILAGVPVVMTDTPGQHPLAADLGRAAAVAAPGDIEGLTSAIAAWATDADRLERAKRAAWQAATRRWHWEHPLERGRLQELVRSALS
jgi:glycosyltransferase involved in cell wall biosynthesis